MEFQAYYLPFAFLLWLILMWWKNLCKCVPLYEKVAQRGGTVRRGIGVGDANLPAHFGRRSAGGNYGIGMESLRLLSPVYTRIPHVCG